MTANTTSARAARKPLQETDAFKAAVAAAVEAQLAEATAKAVAEATAKRTAESGYKSYATKAIAPAIELYIVWLNREFSELYPDATDEKMKRLVQVSLKAYGAFQKSDLSLKATKAAKAA